MEMYYSLTKPMRTMLLPCLVMQIAAQLNSTIVQTLCYISAVLPSIWAKQSATYLGEGSLSVDHIFATLGISAQLKISQISACEIGPRSGIIVTRILPASQPASHHPILAFQIKTYISAATEPIIPNF